MLDHSQSFDLLAAQIYAKLQDNSWKTFGVTSPRVGDGKSTIAHRLALSMAREKKHRVMLVDLNVFNPSVHALFGLSNVKHLGRVVNGELDFADAIQQCELERLKIVASGKTGVEGADLMSSFVFDRLIREISQRYSDRICIFDMPSYLDSNVALTVSPYLDSLLLVVRDGHTHAKDLLAVSRMLSDKKILGFVLNDLK
jgi:protein-tyrosine kinase